MARIFTTSFEFNQQKYDAIVTLTKPGSGLNFNIKVLDAELHPFLPGGEVSYSEAEGFRHHSALDNTVSLAIMRKIEDAIKRHMVIYR